MPVGVAINKEELASVRAKFDELLGIMKEIILPEDRINLEKAYNLAVEGHKYQRRKSGEPYIFHPIEVARICCQEIGLGPTAVVCALLHDVVEDTSITLQEITAAFGPKVTVIVDGLTKLDGTYNNIDHAQAENFKKVLSTLVVDVRVVLIKMADRLHNLRTISAQPKHKQLKIAAETDYIYTPLAHRLGLYNIKTEFQDICLKITEPEVYEELSNKLIESDQVRSEYIALFIEPLKTSLDELDVKFRILGRSKAISSIYTKIKQNKVNFEEIYDIFAVRIVVDVPSEKEKSYCWQIYSIITDVYKPIPERLKDWVTTPKGNGYESLHTTVIGPKGKYVEVQIRTERMDEIAEKGFAAHWKYKGVKKQENVFDNWLDNIREILDTKHTNALEFVNDFKTNLFSEEVYVFTPKGDMRIMPKGATALDFAFEIHTDVGYHAQAIKINNKIVPMGAKLSNGDQVNIVTNKNQKPNEDWLKMVVTGKAKSKIRSAMKEERRKVGEIGKEALERKFKNLKIDLEENVDVVAKNLGFKSRIDLYYGLSMEEVKIADIKNFIIQDGKIIFKKDENDIPIKEASLVVDELKKIQRPTKVNKSNILVNGEPADMYQYSLASCCNPVQGDPIFAYLTINSGLKIHRASCSNAVHILANYSFRVLKAEWADSGNSNFVVELLVTGIDSGPGVIQSLTNELSTLGINIKSFSIEGREGFFEGRIGVVILNKDQLNMVVHSLERLEGISSVTRTDRMLK
jgi:GTP diphosphokinase / guanosine-3',5'-bis(diphosphate) 3'-diphosphatase